MIGGRKGRLVFSVVVALVGLFLFSGVGFSSGGGEGSGTHGNAELTDLLYRGINFALLVIILFVVIRKTAIKDFFSARREEIGKKLDDLQGKKGAEENRYQELAKRLEEFEIKKNEIIEQFKAEGLAEKEKIVAEGKEKARQILEQVDLTIQREIEAGKDRLRQEVVDIAAQKAQEMVAREIKESDHDQLVDEFIERVEKLH